jgi:hypothetical protein
MNRALKLLILLTILVSSCNKLEDAEPDQRSSFIHFYGGSNNFSGVASERINDGYIIAGDSTTSTGSGIVLIKTDLFGKTVWRRLIGGGKVNALKVVSDGYLVIGDSIQINLEAEQVNDIIKRKMRLIKISPDGDKVLDKSFGSFDPNSLRVDFKGHSLAQSSKDSIYSIGSVKFQGARANTLISSHDPNNLKLRWSKVYDLDNRDYLNAKSSHLNSSGNIIWAASATLEQANSSRSYLAVPVLKPNSTFDNNSLFGRNEDIYYSGSDIQSAGIGYGVIGTCQSITGTNANLYFVRTDQQGNIISGSELYFDGELSADNASLADKSLSNSQDEGSALASTNDGGFLLAGSMTTTTVRGSGGKDIWIIRVDSFGKVLWNKIIGGIGDETVATVRQTPDGGFLICGTLNLAGLSSIYLLKTNRNGELRD